MQTKTPPETTTGPLHTQPNGHAKTELVAREIPLSQISPSKTNPRKTFNTEQDAELIESIRQQGVVQPIVVRTSAAGYELVAGERRFRASKAAGLQTIPAVIRTLTDREALEIQIIENLQRVDVRPIEEGNGYKQLIAELAKADPKRGTDRQGVKREDLVAQVAKKVGKSVRYVWARMKLTELVPEVQKALDEGRITATHADELARVHPSQQLKALAQCETEEYINGQQVKVPVSIRELKVRLRYGVTVDLATAKFKPADAELLPKVGACTTCPNRAENSLLHSDLPKNTCLNPPCFGQKQERLVQIAIEDGHLDVVAKPQAAFVIGDTREIGSKIGALKVIPDWKVKEVPPGSCDHTTVAFHWTSGKVKNSVCASSGCAKHHKDKARDGGETPAQYQARLEQQRRDQEVRDQARKVRNAMLLAEFGRSAALKGAADRILQLVVWELSDRIDGHTLAVIAHERKWVLPEKMGWNAAPAIVARYTAKMKSPELLALALQFAASKHLSTHDQRDLTQIAKAFGVNVSKADAAEKSHLAASIAAEKKLQSTAGKKATKAAPKKAVKKAAKKGGRK